MAKKTSGKNDEIVTSVTVALELDVPRERLFAVISDPRMLPRWAQPVKAIRGEGAKAEIDYELPEGSVVCRFDRAVDEASGVTDWTVHVPGADPIRVYSRAVGLGGARSAFVVTLVSPPMPKNRAKDLYAMVEENLTKDMEKVRALVGAK
jgi:uncharacterized protein YndB with AHSA1/START domain